MHNRGFVAFLLVPFLLFAAVAQHMEPKIYFASEIKWTDAPSSLPKRAKIAIS